MRSGTRGGYTLAELAVSLGVFTIVVSIATGAVIRAFRTQRQIVALIAMNNNMSLTIEQIAREMRTGSGFSTTNVTNNITFTNAKAESITYRLNGDAIERQVESGLGQSRPITADNVSVKSVRFYILSLPSSPPRITISIGISPEEASLSSTVIYLQTTISPRFL